MRQLQAGYILDSVRETLEKEFEKETVGGLFKHLSHFDIEITSNEQYDNSEINQILFVADNLISRGLPTRPSLFVEKELLNKFKIATQDDRELEIGSIKFDLNSTKELNEKLFRVFHIIDPRINPINQKIKSWENHLGSEFEENFLYEKLPKNVSPLWVQILESQRDLENILRFSTSIEDEVEQYINGTINIFKEQRVDFSLEFPYKVAGKRGVVIEVDGSQHEEKRQQLVDTTRDEAVEKAQWLKTIRLKTTEWNLLSEKLKPIKELEKENYFKVLKSNFENPLYKDREGQTALQLAIIPLGIARIQKTLLHLLLEGKLNIKDKEWNIGILERDVPCSKIAIDDFQSLLSSLFQLQEKPFALPQINLFVENTMEFNQFEFCYTRPIPKDISLSAFIDFSILQKTGISSLENSLNAKTKVLVRSSHSVNTNRQFKTDGLIKYKPLGERNTRENKFHENKEQVKVLEKFVQDIFRKIEFRPGQVEIINRALQGLSVIGLLPTGSGKSLTYQLASLLQPGMVIVIDPIKSLMKDQFEGLIKNRIDAAVFLNSSVKGKARKIVLERITNAQTIFSFVSPERLQDDTFRKDYLLKASNLNNHYFSFCVIDEAHCVSEWGHDFRTSYLRVGDNARNFCKAKNKKALPFIALTATASYDVLSDIQRELKIPEETSIVRLEKLDRPELQFIISDVVADIDPELGTGYNNRLILGQTKQDHLLNIIKHIPELYSEFLNNKNVVKEAEIFKMNFKPNNFQKDNFYMQEGNESNAGLIFCPHKTWLYGVIGNAAVIKEKFPFLKVGTFIGVDGALKKEEREKIEKENEKNQSAFIDNELNLLAATKAFGMGIDKPNIRYLIHFNYPSSIESYYQEAGRGGRDKKLSLGVILFNKQLVKSKEKFERVTEDGEITEVIEETEITIDKDILQSFHRKNFKGIAKEKKLLFELLNEIRFPSKKFANFIEDRIFDEFETVVQLRVATNNTQRQVLYINPKVGSIYLDRDNYPFYINEENNLANANQVSSFIQKIISTEKPPNHSAYDWLSQFTPSSTQDGIEKLLNNPQKPDKFIVVIPFTNNGIEKITEFLISKELNFTDRLVYEAQKYCFDKEEFISNLSETTAIPTEIKTTLGKLFNEIRNEEDTFKVIYRLSIIEVIDDYTIDYNSKTVSAYISRKPSGHYTLKLKEYLLQYSSPEKVDENLKRLPFFKGSSEIQKCLGFLIKFVYEETASQRKAAIDATEDACIIGLEEDGSKKFKEFVDLYMNSKYARPQYLPADTEKGLKADFSVVLKYMDLVRTDIGEVNNFKHLRGAAVRLLVQRPDNFVFILLKSFSVLLIEKENENFTREAQLDFINGFVKLFETTKEDVIAVKEKVETFKSKIRNFDNDAAELLDEAESSLYLKLHTHWTINFNNKFTL